jgi:hypothetical protein
LFYSFENFFGFDKSYVTRVEKCVSGRDHI